MRAHDFRQGVRLLRRNPAMAAITVCMISLGIGINCAAFSVLNTILFHPPPFSEPGRIVEIRQRNVTRGLSQQLVSVPDYEDWKRAGAFESMAAWNFQYFNLTGDDQPERLEGLTVTSEFFSVLGIRPAIGRLFLHEDQRPGGEPVAILTDALWRRRFGGNPAIVGRSVLIESQPYRIIGVLPAGFRFFRVLNRELDLYLPLMLDPARASRADHLLFVYARLKHGVSIEHAKSEMDKLEVDLARQYPETNTGWSAEMTLLHDQWTRPIRPILLLVQTAAALVLAIAWANIASLFIARAVARRREMAIRIALGANRLQLFGQMLGESLAAAIFGALGGVSATVALIWFANQVPYTVINRVEPFRMDGRVLSLGLVLAVLASVLVSIAGAWQSSTRALKSDESRRRKGSALVFVQTALTTILLSAAGLLVHSAILVSAMDRGLDPHNVLSVQLWLPPARYRDSDRIVRFWRDAIDRTAALPGVIATSAVSFPPLSRLSDSVAAQFEGAVLRRR